jgi:hypothetical protein
MRRYSFKAGLMIVLISGLVFLHIGQAGAAEETINEFFDQVAKAEERYRSFILSEQKAEKEIALLEVKRKDASERYFRARNGSDRIAVQEAKADYILATTEILVIKYGLIKKGIEVYYKNSSILRTLRNRLREEMGERTRDPETWDTLQMESQRMESFIQNIDELTHDLGSFIEPAKSTTMKAKVASTRFNLRSIKRHIESHRNKFSGRGKDPSQVAIVALDKYVTALDTGYIAFRDLEREFDNEKKRMELATMLATAELAAIDIGSDTKIKSIKLTSDRYSKDIKDIQEDNNTIFFDGM